MHQHAQVRELQSSQLAFDGLQEQLEAARGAQDDVRALQEAYRALVARAAAQEAQLEGANFPIGVGRFV